jgi:hypothetical protein
MMIYQNPQMKITKKAVIKNLSTSHIDFKKLFRDINPN